MPNPHEDDSTRYEAQGEIGRGGMGSVERVYDRVRGGVVARKRILDPSAVAFLRFKTEFRVIERLHHPSLVRLYELGQDAVGPFFTMELIDGVDLATYCGRTGEDGSSLDEAKLRHALSQLLGVLAFLHARGVVHCDLKPSNVMVRSDGVLKLLDFGILSQFGTGRGGTLPGGAGTPAYMAPEISAANPPSPASDLYSLGIVLDELYTGRRKRFDEASSIRARSPGIDPRVGAAVDGLSALDPARRPTLEQLSTAFGFASRAVRGPSLPRLVGREVDLGRLLDDLGESFDGKFAATALRGASGVGKSALVRELARVAERGGAVVLRSRAHLRERLAFNGLDEAADELARAFLTFPERFASPAIGDLTARASVLFPALIATLTSRVDLRAVDRGAAFVAFVELLEHVASRGSALVIVVDDLQWIDADAAALLSMLVERKPARVLLVATLRDDLPSLGAAESLLAAGGIAVRNVPPLDEAALTEIARTGLGSFDGERPARDVAEIVRLAEGRPMLVELALRAMDASPASTRAPRHALEQHLGAMDEVARNVVAALYAFDGWMDDATLAESVGATGVIVDEHLSSLERQGIVRVGASATGGRDAEISHDLVRTAAAATLPAGVVVAMHGRIGALLAGRPGVPDARIVRHLFAGGNVREAAKRARSAMQNAYEKHAYDLAAELATIATHDPEGNVEAPLELRARAFEASGRYAEAAEAYAALAKSAPPRRARSARTAEATALLSSGEVARGRAMADAILSTWGGAVSRAVVRALAALRFLRGPQAIADAGENEGKLTALDAEREERLATMVVYFDPLEGLALLQRAQRTFDRTGAYGEAAFGDFLCAYWALFAARKAGDVPVAAKYVEAGHARLARSSDPPLRAVGMPVLVRGVVHQRAGRRDDANATFAEALRILADGGAAHTIDAQLVSLHPAYLAFLRGAVPEAKIAHAHLQSTMRGGPDNALACHERLFGVWMAKLEGRFERARAEADAILAGWPDVPTFQRVWVAVVAGSIGIYEGDAIAERRRVAAALKRDARFRVFDNLYAGMLASWLALLDVRALRQGDAKVRRADVARWAAIAREAPPMGTSGALRAMAYLDEIAGADRARVLARLEDAEATATASGEIVDAAIARYQRGVRLGGAFGAPLVREAEAMLDRIGASARLLAECTPPE